MYRKCLKWVYARATREMFFILRPASLPIFSEKKNALSIFPFHFLYMYI